MKFLQFFESTLFKLINGERNDDKRLSKNAYELKQSNNNSTLTIFCRKTTMNDAYLHSIGLQSGWVAPCQKSAEKMEGMVALTKTSLNGKNVGKPPTTALTKLSKIQNFSWVDWWVPTNLPTYQHCLWTRPHALKSVKHYFSF